MKEVLNLTSVYNNSHCVDDFNIFDIININFNKSTQEFKITNIRKIKQEFKNEYEITQNIYNIKSRFLYYNYLNLIHFIKINDCEKIKIYLNIVHDFIIFDIFNDDLNFDIIKYNLTVINDD